MKNFLQLKTPEEVKTNQEPTFSPDEKNKFKKITLISGIFLFTALFVSSVSGTLGPWLLGSPGGGGYIDGSDNSTPNIESDEITIKIEQLNKGLMHMALNPPRDNNKGFIEVDYRHNNDKKIIAEKPLVEYYYTVRVPTADGGSEYVEGRKVQIDAVPEGLEDEEIELDGSGTVTWEIDIPELDYGEININHDGEDYTIKVNWFLEVSVAARDERNEVRGFFNGDIDIID
jgi:hypothetical protein